MQEYKFIRVLNQFDAKDIKRLHLFLDSPYFKHKNDNVLFIKELCILNKTPDFDFKEIWKRLYPIQFNEKRLRKKLHDCLIILQNFLALENYSNSNLQQSKNLLDESVSRHINELIPKGIQTLESNLENEDALTFEYYSYRFHLYDTLNNLAGFDRKIAIRKNKDSSEYLIKADKILNEIFLSEKLRLSHLLYHDNYNSNRNDELTFVKEVYQFAQKTARRGSKPHFYLQLLNLSNSKNKLSEITKLQKYISHKNKLFSYEEFRNIVFTLINETVRLINTGVKESHNIVFQLYRTGLENNSFFVNNHLLPDTFRNIVVSASLVGEFDWAFDFIQHNSKYLKNEFRQTAIAFNMALIYRQMGDYEKVVSNLMSVDYEDLGYILRSKGMLLTAYYELKEFDALDSLIKSFNVFLRRKTNISEKRKASFKNFNSTLQDIVRAKERRDKVKLKTVRKKLESKMVTPNKSWLLEKVEELEKELGVKQKHEKKANS